MMKCTGVVSLCFVCWVLSLMMRSAFCLTLPPGQGAGSKLPSVHVGHCWCLLQCAGASTPHSAFSDVRNMQPNRPTGMLTHVWP